MAFPFNIRVYGALIFRGSLLLSDEAHKGRAFTKLPGGGLEFGEGLRDALKREFREELRLHVEVTDHLYTTDFFQRSAFNPDHQIISVYYRVVPMPGPPFGAAAGGDQSETQGGSDFSGRGEKLPVLQPAENDQKLRWVPLSTLTAEHFTFPIDKKMVPKLRAQAVVSRRTT